MVIITRSKSVSKSDSMALSTEMKLYLDNLIKPLVTNEAIVELFNTLKNELTEQYEQRLVDNEREIKELKKRVATQQATIGNLLISSDDNEQYSRRNCLRIIGIEEDEKETNDELMQKIETCYDSVELPFERDSIDRAHRIGKPYVDEKSGKRVKQVLIKYKSWQQRVSFYKARPTRKSIETKGKQKPGEPVFTVKVDLTKRRYLLLKKAQERINNGDKSDNVLFAFSDVNCALGIKFSDGTISFFNSESKLNEMLNS